MGWDEWRKGVGWVEERGGIGGGRGWGRDGWRKGRRNTMTSHIIPIQAIGSSAQGLANALLFCVFTSTVRKRLTKLLKRVCCICCRNKDESVYLLEPSTGHSCNTDHENTTQYEEEVSKTTDTTWQVSINSPGIFPNSLDNSKYHSIKSVTAGAE
jgi:hypothetical protein